MSGFDKEAERERLREKYERDQEKRAATQRMSELLLQGATMTNSHCDDCGDPIFRYDGQEFCPTCRGEEGADQSETAATDQPATADPSESAGQPEAATDGETSATDRTAPADGAASATDATRQRRRPPSADVGSTDDRVRDLVEDGVAAPEPRDAPEQRDASVDAARASLTRTLVGYARAAEEAEDPRRATELLEVAREAAETLDALDRLR